MSTDKINGLETPEERDDQNDEQGSEALRNVTYLSGMYQN